MKKLPILLIASLLISGCGKEEKANPEDYVTVHIEKRSDGLAYEQNKKKPFTGIFEGYYRNGYKKAEIHFKNGKQNGSAKMWHENGQLSNEANFYDGKLEGMATEWRADGTKNKDRIFRDGKLTGSLD
jgi:antitoxin component YwqK of YwqJK toxin-antitoxin module